MLQRAGGERGMVGGRAKLLERINSVVVDKMEEARTGVLCAQRNAPIGHDWGSPLLIG